MKEEAVSLFLSIAIFAQTLFYAVFALFGVSASRVNSYIYLGIFILSILIVAFRLLTKQSIGFRTFVGMVLCLIIILHHYVTEFRLSEQTNSFVYYFVLWGLGTLLLIGTSSLKEIRRAIKYVEIINVIHSIATILVIIRFYSSGERIVNRLSFGGETYNTISYVAATCVGLYLYYLYFCEKDYRFLFLQGRGIRILYWALIGLSSLATLLSGGRGGALLLIVYVLLFLRHFNHEKRTFKEKTIVITLISICLAILFYASLKNDILIGSLNRTFSYITKHGFDLTQTSYRDQVYLSALSEIKKRPVLGYGPLNYPGGIYPHNIILELLLSGGVVYFTLGGFILLKILTRAVHSIKLHNEATLMSFLFVSSFVMLMFSGTLYTNVKFWAAATYFGCRYDIAVHE